MIESMLHSINLIERKIKIRILASIEGFKMIIIR